MEWKLQIVKRQQRAFVCAAKLGLVAAQIGLLGANSIIALRYCRLSGRFEDFWNAEMTLSPLDPSNLPVHSRIIPRTLPSTSPVSNSSVLAISLALATPRAFGAPFIVHQKTFIISEGTS